MSPQLRRGSLAPLVALLLNIFAWMDVIAVTPSLMDLIIHADAQLGRNPLMAAPGRVD